MPITLKQMHWSGIYSFSEREQTFEFKPGFYLLVGENGAGKSSFLNLLTLVLFDHSPSVGKKECINEKAKSGKIKLEFSVDDIDYELEYIRTSKNFYWSLTRGGTPVITGAETGKYLEKLLGFSYDQFINAFYLTQNSHFSLKLFFGDPSDRLTILSRVFGLDRFLVASEKASERAKDIERLINNLEINKADSVATRKVHEENLASPELQNVAERLASACLELQQKTEENDRKAKILEQELDSYNKESDQLNARGQELSTAFYRLVKEEGELKTKLNKLQEQHDKYVEFTGFKDDYEELLRERDALKSGEKVTLDLNNNIAGDIVHSESYISEIKEKIEKIMRGEGKCDRCGSFVTSEQLNSFRHELLDDAELQEYALEKLRAGLSEGEARLKALQDEIDQIDKDVLRFKVKYSECLDGRITPNIAAQLKEEKIRFEKVHDDLEEVSKKETARLKEKEIHDQHGQDISLHQKELNDIQSILIKLDTQKYHLERQVEQEKTLQSTISSLTTEIQDLETKIVNATKQLSMNKFWVTGFKELATLRLTGYIDGINAKMQELLEGFGMNCWIDVLEAKKSAKDMFSLDSYKRKANLFVSADGKTGVPIEAYSGGEKQLLSLAMILALGSVVGSINILMLDEVFGSLDTANRVKILELLNSEKRKGLLSGSCVLMVSHDDDIKNGADFEYIVRIQKGDGGSELLVEEV